MHLDDPTSTARQKNPGTVSLPTFRVAGRFRENIRSNINSYPPVSMAGNEALFCGLSFACFEGRRKAVIFGRVSKNGAKCLSCVMC